MAFRHGSKAALSVNGTLITSFTDSTSLSRDLDTAETTVFGVSDKTFIGGLLGGNISFSGGYDPTVTTGEAAVLEGALVGAVPVTIIFYPGGTLTGQRSHTFSALITNYTEGSTVGDKVTYSCTALVTGAVTTATL